MGIETAMNPHAIGMKRPVEIADPDLRDDIYNLALEDEVRRMARPSVIALDLDKVYLMGGNFPLTGEGHLDIEKLNEQSPLTLPIMEILNDLKLRGVLVPTITGKSHTVLAFFDLQNRMFYRQAGERDMLATSFVITPNSSGILFDKEVHIKPEYIEPHTGRLRAQEGPEGAWRPSQTRLALNFYSVDNGSTTWEAHPDGHMHSEKFRRNLLFLLTHDDVIDLLADSTRSFKKDRQNKLRNVHVSLPGIDQQHMHDKPLRNMTNKELWKLVVMKVFEFSYASPHKTKFNLELGVQKILNNERLRSRWTRLLQKITHDSTRVVHDPDSLIETVRLLFENKAQVTLNYVHEAGGAEGGLQRVVIDLNPVGKNKLTGLEHMTGEAEALYRKAGLPVPDFVGEAISAGDGPDKNDRELIQRAGGATNFSEYHSKLDGYPVDMTRIFSHFNIDVMPYMKLDDAEQTYLFLRLIQHEFWGRKFKKDDMPESLRRKIVIHQTLKEKTPTQ